MKTLFTTTLPFLALAGLSNAAPLSSYTHVTTRLLNGISEASTVAYNPDTGTLFALGDEGEAIFEFNKAGDLLGSMPLNIKDSNGEKTLVDPEGLAYLGGNLYMIADERPMTGLLTAYTEGVTAQTAEMPIYEFDPVYANNANVGLEGVCYDPVNNSVWGVKEHSPFGIYELKDIGLPTANVTKPFAAREFNRLDYLTDIADIFVMANSPHFASDDPRRMNLLILSQEDNLILEMTRSGQVVEVLDISFIGAHTIEGITMDGDGVIYLVSEQPVGSIQSALHILTPPSQATPFQTWGTSMGLEGDDALPDADPDLDGRNNLAEYTFGGHPGSPDGIPASPACRSTPSGMTWTYIRRTGDPSVQYVHKQSTDLVEWTEFTPELAPLAAYEALEGFEQVTVILPAASPDSPRFFKAEAALAPGTP